MPEGRLHPSFLWGRDLGVVDRRDRDPDATTLRSRLLGNDGRRAIASCLLVVAFSCFAKEAVPEAADAALEARMVAIASELRCLVCQNQTIADSHADLAVDLRRQVREQLQAGRSDREIVDYMTARYGDFVLYRPPFKPTTALLWLGPALMLVVGGTVAIVVLKRRQRMAPEAFERDDGADDDADDVADDDTDDADVGVAKTA